jgi:hypothetical protein
MTDKPNIHALPSATDETQASVDAMIRILPILTRAASEIARYRKASYDAHIAAGFTPDQALILCQRSEV